MTWIKKNFWVGVVLFAALLLRLPLLGGSFWLDEAAQVLESARPLAQQLQLRDDFQPPLIHLLVHFLLGVSRDEWWLRLGAALIPGLVTIGGTVMIGKNLGGKGVGLLAGFLLASSSFHIFYSQELRPYSLPAMFGVLAWWIILEMQEVKLRKTWVWAMLLAVVTALGMYSSYLYPFLVIAQVGYVMMCGRRRRLVVFGAVAAAALSFLPWLSSFLDQLRAGQMLRQTLPGWEQVVSFTQTKAILLTLGKFTFGVVSLKPDIPIIFATAIFVMLAALSLFFFRHTHTTRQLWQSMRLTLFWLVTPVALIWLTSFVVPVLQPKRVLFCLPAFFLFLAQVLIQLMNSQSTKREAKWARVVGLLLFVTLLTINAWSSWSYFTQPRYQREDWRGLYEQVVHQYNTHDTLAVQIFLGPFASWNWYNTSHFPTLATGALLDPNADLVQLKKMTEYRYVLVFDYLRDLTDPHDLVFQKLRQYGYQEVDTITPTTPLGLVHVYARPATTVGLRK